MLFEINWNIDYYLGKYILGGLVTILAVLRSGPGIIGGASDQTRVSHMQGQYLTPCSISPVPHENILISISFYIRLYIHKNAQ